MRRLLPRMVAVLALLGVALCAPAFGQNSDPISLWSVPSVRVDGADPSAFTPDTTASLFKPATVSFTIPYDPRWADPKGWDIDTDENEYSAILTFHGTDGAVHNVQFGMQIPQLQRAVKRGRPTIEIPRDVMPGTPLVVTLQGSEARPGARHPFVGNGSAGVVRQRSSRERTAHRSLRLFPRDRAHQRRLVSFFARRRVSVL